MNKLKIQDQNIRDIVYKLSSWGFNVVYIEELEEFWIANKFERPQPKMDLDRFIITGYDITFNINNYDVNFASQQQTVITKINSIPKRRVEYSSKYKYVYYDSNL
jgi:NDP-sugar pyrophosphorylase family protein